MLLDGVEPSLPPYHGGVLPLHTMGAWQACQDSNLERLSQSQLCYHYTTRQQMVPRDRIELPFPDYKTGALPLN